ncbi:galactokinase [Ptychographa xylographoides]|nr:galactokinase [Ptychographa xylographoides]
MPPKTMHEPVPVTGSLDLVYEASSIPAQEKRWTALRQQFSSLYGHSPSFIARSPGRVNIIGEHIDYSLYDVLPMAIEADVLVAVSTSPTSGTGPVHISIANRDSQTFKSSDFTVSGDTVEIDASTHQWTNYFKAGLQGALSLMKTNNPSLSPKNMSILVDGTVPPGGGLSSSAAFVCASALAILHANDPRPISKRELVELAIVSERAVGVNSGGMDQAASVFSVRGDAVSVSFSPELHAEAIAFPETDPPITFMIAQSFVAADKHVTGPECYNLRVVECTLAAEFVAAHLGLKLEDDSAPLARSLRGLQNAFFKSSFARLDADMGDEDRLGEMVRLVESNLGDESGYTRETIAAKLDLTVPELEERYMTKFPVRAEVFLLRQRALHVFTEAIRVAKFKTLLRSTVSTDTQDALQRQLGALMNETQASCRDVYQCSCAELDELCTIAREAGAYGSRLTGAGWGGCSVHLVPMGKVEEVRKAWEKKYYRAKFPDITKEKLDEAVVASEPGQGSVMYGSSTIHSKKVTNI